MENLNPIIEQSLYILFMLLYLFIVGCGGVADAGCAVNSQAEAIIQ